MEAYVNSGFELIEMSIEKYLQRGYKHLQLNFGCTGGRHRSVYSVEKIAALLKERFKSEIEILLQHRELGIENKL
jgi:RNase adaptor protein for sRNA GlmZ degradation